MTIEERQKRTAQLYAMPVNVLIELVIKLEEDNKAVRELRRRLNMIRNIATDPDERRGRGRPSSRPSETPSDAADPGC